MCSKLSPISKKTSSKFVSGLLAASNASILTISLFSSSAFAESSLAGDDPLAWLERPVDCAVTDSEVNSRYGSLLSGAAKNSLLSEEFKFVSSETCTGKRFASCTFSWCKQDSKAAAKEIEGKVSEFSKAHAAVKSRGWEFEGDEDHTPDYAKDENTPAGNLVAAAAQDTTARGSLRRSVDSELDGPVFVLGKNSIPTLPNGVEVKGIKRVSGSFMPVAYAVAEKKVDFAVDKIAPAEVAPVAAARVLAAAEVVIEPVVAPVIAPVATVVESPKVSEVAKLSVEQGASVALVERTPRVVSLVDTVQIALRAEAERELLDLEQKLRARVAGRIGVRVRDEQAKKIGWKVVEVPGASQRASSLRSAGATEAIQIKGANTGEYSRSIVPGIGQAPANTVTSKQEQLLSKYNIKAPVAERFQHADPANPSAPPLPLAQPAVPQLQSGQPKQEIGVAVPVEEGDLASIRRLSSFKASSRNR